MKWKLKRKHSGCAEERKCFCFSFFIFLNKSTAREIHDYNILKERIFLIFLPLHVICGMVVTVKAAAVSPFPAHQI